jgi:SAM-dependent methyltransferase
MSRFGEDPLSFFDAIYHGDAPWDIGGPQPAMADLVERFPPAGPILDIGCGTGDLALHLAGMGHRVIGIDFAERAIAQAQERAAGLSPETAGLLDFRVADGLNPAALGMSFGAVFDSGFYHLFDPDDGRRYAAELAKVLAGGGRFYLHAFAVEFDIPNAPRAVSEAELRTVFSSDRGWTIRFLADAEFHSRVAPPVDGITACIERSPE